MNQYEIWLDNWQEYFEKKMWLQENYELRKAMKEDSQNHRLTVEALLDRIDLLKRQIRWLCNEIPRIGSEYEEDFVAWSYCPSREVAQACIYKMQAPDSVCAECWKKASQKAVETQQSSQPEKA